MSSPSNPKGNTYADRPATPFGEQTGLTSTSVPEPTSTGGDASSLAPNPYHYQPAIVSTRPELTALRRNSTNYAQAYAESLQKFTYVNSPDEAAAPGQEYSSSPRSAGERSYSFSAEDLKRSKYHHLMTDEVEEKREREELDEQGLRKEYPKSPGVGNSEMKGREFGFTSAG